MSQILYFTDIKPKVFKQGTKWRVSTLMYGYDTWEHALKDALLWRRTASYLLAHHNPWTDALKALYEPALAQISPTYRENKERKQHNEQEKQV